MFDFAIVGGGVAGLSAAARLAPFGSVLLLEREPQLGYHSSGRSAALFEENYGQASTIALNRASLAYLRDEDDGVLSPRGLLLVGGPKTRDAFENDVSNMRLEKITPREARNMIPIFDPRNATDFALHSDAFDIDTDLLMQNYRRRARNAGAEIRAGVGVDTMNRTANGWRIDTSAGSEEARIVVNTAGAWADSVAICAGVAPLGITPYRRSMARIPPPGGHDTRAWPMMFGPGEKWYAKPDAGKLLVSPADEDAVEPHDAWADDMVLAEGIARYEEVVTEPVTRVENTWAGLRSFAPDRQLVIGFEPEVRGFFWLAGQGGYGIQSSPGASQLCADLITGNCTEFEPDIVAALSPGRLR